VPDSPQFFTEDATLFIAPSILIWHLVSPGFEPKNFYSIYKQSEAEKNPF
jgi:hypothetical protein